MSPGLALTSRTRAAIDQTALQNYDHMYTVHVHCQWLATHCTGLGAHQQVSADQHSGGPRPELPHNQIPIFLFHVSMLVGKEEEEWEGGGR